MPEIVCFMPNGDELFPESDPTLEDLRELQRNPAFHLMVQRLRSEAYAAAMTGEATRPGLAKAFVVLGSVEYELQREPQKENAEEEEE